MTPELDELDSLLKESLSLATEVDQAKRRLRKFNVSEDEALALREIIHAYEERHNWHSIGLVLLVQRQNCACGSVHEFAQGEFLRQAHIRTPGTSRMVRNNWPNCSLPRSIEYHDSSTNLCTTCAEEWRHG